MSTPASGPAILVAEDNPDDLFFFERVLRQTGARHPLRAFDDGQKLIDYLGGGAPRPGVIFLDIKMPLKSGFDVLEWTRGQPALAGVPIVMLSGSAVASDIAKAKSLGAHEYLVKPATSEQLASLVRLLADVPA